MCIKYYTSYKCTDFNVHPCCPPYTLKDMCDVIHTHQQLWSVNFSWKVLTCRLCFLPLQGERGYSIPTYITAVYCVLTGHVQTFCQHPVSYSVGLGKCSQGSQCIQLMYYCWHAESLINCVTHVSCSEIPLVHWTPWTAISPYNITTSTWLTQCL